MPKPCSLELRERVVDAVESGASRTLPSARVNNPCNNFGRPKIRQCSKAILNNRPYLGHRNIQHTVRYAELPPTRFRHSWRDGCLQSQRRATDHFGQRGPPPPDREMVLS